jgi:tetratricopeptide (TPR) repeat protein
MKNFIMAFAVLFAFACNNNLVPSNTSYQNKEIVNEKNNTILVGHNAPYMMKQGIYKEWYDKNYSGYSIDSNTIQNIKPQLKNKTIEIFLGTWCGDSKREVPRMMKILEYAGFDTAHLKLVFIDHVLEAYKQSPEHEEKRKNIHHVPTFIVYDEKKEIGRIVESPVASLEKDLLAIVNKGSYVPNHKAIIQWQKEVKNRNKFKSEDQIKIIANELKPNCSFWGEFNAYGYMLYSQKKINETKNVFLLNTFLFPDKPGPFSSLGEYYLLTGNKPEARRCYEKVLQLKPDDANAKKLLEQL